jgi:hypothetical protein
VSRFSSDADQTHRFTALSISLAANPGSIAGHRSDPASARVVDKAPTGGAVFSKDWWPDLDSELLSPGPMMLCH